MYKQCVIVQGAESSGTRLISRIAAHVLDCAKYRRSNHTPDVVRSDDGANIVVHRSLPYGRSRNPGWESVADLVDKYCPDGYTLKFVLPVRYSAFVRQSKLNHRTRGRPGPPSQSVQDWVDGEIERAREHLHEILASPYARLIMSYETLLYLGGPYLQELYRFLGVRSDFVPGLIDGNRKYL
jgi:hypothetical protein